MSEQGADDTTAKAALDASRAQLAAMPNELGFAAKLNEGVLERSGLDLRTFHLVRVAALAASGSPAIAWQANLERMGDDVALEDLQGALAAIAPIIGTARYLSAVTTLANL